MLGPPKSEHVLEGIRYELISELCEECGIAYNLRPIPEGEVIAADEILLSSATKEVLPVTTLDGDAVGHGALRGKPGPVYARLYEAYQRAKADPVDLRLAVRRRIASVRIARISERWKRPLSCRTSRPNSR